MSVPRTPVKIQKQLAMTRRIRDQVSIDNCPKIGPVADITKVSLKYFDVLSNFTASVGYYSNVFRINSFYDVDYSGTGAQPTGFDQWAAFYNKYRVFSVAIKVQILGPQSASQLAPPLIYGFYPSIDTSTETSYQNAVQKPRCKHKTSSWVSTNTNTLTGVFTMNEILGLSPDQYLDDPNTAAVTTTNPSLQAYLTVFCYNLNGTWSASASANPSVLVELTLTGEFFERINLDASLFFRHIRDLSQILKEIKEKDLPPTTLREMFDFYVKYGGTVQLLKNDPSTVRIIGKPP